MYGYGTQRMEIAVAFALLITTMNSTNFSFSGLKALASGTTVIVGCSADLECPPGQICNAQGFCQADPAALEMQTVTCPGVIGDMCLPPGNGCGVTTFW